ncbi:hypothetical protein B0H13DRAFT_2677804 [Mycena leptocephala]|nr:hypothetical protein B0H13DRAFT_2677804 [Mycena leptocephala]
MSTTPFSVRAILLEQTERTRRSSNAEIEQLIKESELKITSLESQITALVELRDRERTTLAALRYLIAPIHTLPVELLAEIFLLTIGDYVERATQSWHIKDAFRVAHVCSDWRQVAHSTPRLWTGPIDVDLRSNDLEEVYADRLKAWLALSAPLPIPIFLQFKFADWTTNISSCIIEEVLRIAPRLRSVRIPNPTTSSMVRQLAAFRLDSLEELELDEILDHYPRPMLSFSTVPRLRKLRICLHSDSTQILVPWAQLTDLTTYEGSYPDDAVDILGQCTSLVKATVETVGWSQLPQARADFVILNHLRVLSLNFWGRSPHFMPFLDFLSAPALEELCLNFADMGPRRQPWTQADFTAFQLRSPNITRLDLTCSNLTSDDLTTALLHAPSLTHLKILACDCCFGDTLIQALQYKDGVEPLVPRLHHLIRDSENDENVFSEDILTDMIASRWWTDTELAAHSAPPAVARWTHVQLYYAFSQRLLDILKDLPSDVLIR